MGWIPPPLFAFPALEHLASTYYDEEVHLGLLIQNMQDIGPGT